MDDRNWLILHLLYSQKNITKTAQLLFLTQPALTKRLMQIEAEFGVKIVNRGIKGVRFTPEGELLAKRAGQILTSIRDIREEVSNLQQSVAGTLRLGVSNFFAKYKLPGLLKLFSEQYPLVDFHVETGLSKDVLQKVYNHDVHIGFVRGDYSWHDQKRRLFAEKVLLVSRTETNLAQLPELPRIDYETDQMFKSLVDNWWAENYSKPPLISMKVDRGDTCKEMVLNGLGYAILPSMFVSDIVDLYKMELRSPENEPVLRNTWMFYHEESLEKNVVKAFIQFMEGIDLEGSEEKDES
ncbi:DNA-binding transcriptional LysR family regulator [Cytobacillus firmus]|uniref:DNA-binding transcriptional LysR family regulator n=2 Tax=Cytobacillus TaxID=2675230 RepID=A0A366JC69_CYTFI|nr:MULTISPECIES: LysR family transcriptional regulator [Cytobacillus]RBP84407.1 DNA-binding transcriptional LysR family regulator [Cytobacillus firmus]TDX34563.1 DNA-binding transcriptional LysR family regulator [Cytobacillus oceanisediminis]